ncbi:hypothetical protein BLL42_23990 [Pseudomonas frederiksbergensis]|uniref:Uncharacterized protein n=1 Tax=Pseudomonas frederiksbergensis TaxID=104087 RepID=A0A1J0ERS2_9PSED|nr:hypothetical protein BLL42_23990 [Pseudomonas frederiksbergensis]
MGLSDLIPPQRFWWDQALNLKLGGMAQHHAWQEQSLIRDQLTPLAHNNTHRVRLSLHGFDMLLVGI